MKRIMAILMIVSLFGCVAGKFNFRATYDADIVLTGQQAAALDSVRYNNIKSSPLDKRQFDLFATDYLQEEGYINKICFADSIRPRAVKNFLIIKSIRTQFLHFEQIHKDQNNLSDAQISALKDEMMGLWKAWRISETTYIQ